MQLRQIGWLPAAGPHVRHDVYRLSQVACCAAVLAEATNDYYRSIYADPLLGPIFRGMVLWGSLSS